MSDIANKLLKRLVMLSLFLLVCGSDVFAQLSTVSIIIDGDRIVLSDGRKISLAGVDAPEKHPSIKLTRDATKTGKSEAAVIFQGEKSARHLTMLSGGYPVILTQHGSVNQEGYLPAIVYVVDDKGKPMYSLNQRMIEDGFAVTDVDANDRIVKQFARLQETAWRMKRGLWASQEIFVDPQKGESEDSNVIIPLGNCRRDSACIWVTATGDANGPGVWKSRPGRKCSCARKETP